MQTSCDQHQWQLVVVRVIDDEPDAARRYNIASTLNLEVGELAVFPLRLDPEEDRIAYGDVVWNAGLPVARGRRHPVKEIKHI